MTDTKPAAFYVAKTKAIIWALVALTVALAFTGTSMIISIVQTQQVQDTRRWQQCLDNMGMHETTSVEEITQIAQWCDEQLNR